MIKNKESIPFPEDKQGIWYFIIYSPEFIIDHRIKNSIPEPVYWGKWTRNRRDVFPENTLAVMSYQSPTIGLTIRKPIYIPFSRGKRYKKLFINERMEFCSMVRNT